MTAAPATHFSRIRRLPHRTITGTLCNRMVGAGEINCTDDPRKVTCKLCQRELARTPAERAVA